MSVTNGLHYATGFTLILQGGKGKGGQKDGYLQYLIKDRRVPGQKAVVCAFGDIKVLTLQGNALEPCICRSRYINVKEDYKNERKFGESENTRIFANVRLRKNL